MAVINCEKWNEYFHFESDGVSRRAQEEGTGQKETPKEHDNIPRQTCPYHRDCDPLPHTMYHYERLPFILRMQRIHELEPTVHSRPVAHLICPDHVNRIWTPNCDIGHDKLFFDVPRSQVFESMWEGNECR